MNAKIAFVGVGRAVDRVRLGVACFLSRAGARRDERYRCDEQRESTARVHRRRGR